MKKSIVTFMAAATLFAAATPVFAQDTTSSWVEEGETAVVFTDQDKADAANTAAEIDAFNKEHKDGASYVENNQSMGQGANDVYIQDAPETQVPGSQGAAYATEAEKAAAEAAKSEDKAADTKAPAAKVAHNSVKAASTQQGSKALPKTSAVK